ncbi:response regulator [Salinisphaera aquimarina]|uniref:Response regulator n=1 Tax=Salinisphaera aquimarina TaxID=2094031 RepID=A0ABV7EVE3_9GAMM
MSRTELAPYFHPTQIVLVDDDIDFLGNLSLQLEADLPYLLFDSTHKALSYINDRKADHRSRQRFFRVSEGPGDERQVVIDTESIVREMHFSNRFSQISVAMVDYAMPQMNGLEFCRRIENPHIKKILFTGVATESDAVEAFNTGVIDRFIRKSERHVYDHLNSTIRELQQAHIRDTFAAASDVLDVAAPALLADPEIIALMDDLRTRYRIVEYYLVSEPTGFLLVDGEGHLYRLVLSSPADREFQVKRAKAANAPSDCLKILARGEALLDPAVLDAAAARSDILRHWPRYARGAVALKSDPSCRWAVFDQRDVEGAPAAPQSTFSRYLEWLDTVGYSLM